jgi:hypothetical protein
MSVLQAIDRAARMATLAVALISLSPAAQAQQPSAASMAAAKEIISINGATTLFDALIPGVVEQAKLLFLQQNPGLNKDLTDVAATLRADFAPRFSELTNELARLYATNFTEQELKDVLTFYKSPAGKKLIVAQPNIAEQSMRFAQDWANKLSDEVIAKMREAMKKKGHVL